jgi:hypothetical protein
MPRTLNEHLTKPEPKRILSLDGGGVRGLITLGILQSVEATLATRSPDAEAFRLSHYFDLIGGTSTGAIIATLLALGHTVAEVIELYVKLCPQVFGSRRRLHFIQSKFDSQALEDGVTKTINDFARSHGHDAAHPLLESDLLKTGLAIVAKRIDTAAMWVLTNNPRAKYWHPDHETWRGQYDDPDFHPNAEYELRKIVQASASAPFFLDAVLMNISKDQLGLFLDGGASPFNNPARELLLMAALQASGGGGNGKGVPPHGFGWESGKDKLYMLSVGTGLDRPRVAIDTYRGWWALSKAVHVLRGIIYDANIDTVTWMQAISHVTKPQQINGNLLDMRGLHLGQQPLLTFRRVDPPLDCPNKLLPKLREFDNASQRNLDWLLRIGRAAGKAEISNTDFPAAFDDANGTSAAAAPPETAA